MPKWTADQEKAIEQRNCNLLVSAAAGSGKTAVLVERILGRVMDPANPVDIDSILVVTFTKAAASEMHERLLQRIQKEVLKCPASDRARKSLLMKQLSLADHAKVCTIDSFCSYILHNYYNYIDIDPSARVGDRNELQLLSRDVFDQLLEQYFEKAEEDFIRFIEAFSPGKKVDDLYDIVSRLYEYSMSMPWPEKWLMACDEIYRVSNESELMENKLAKATLAHIHNTIALAIEEYRNLISITESCSDIASYLPNLQNEYDILKLLSEKKTFSEMHCTYTGMFQSLKGAKGSCPEKEYIKTHRDIIKKRLKEIDDTFLSEPLELTYGKVKLCHEYTKTLISITLDYLKAFESAKRERNLLDFSDVEHFALQILVQHKDGIDFPSKVAEEVANSFTEIYIDEYQDSNYVQELILTSVSRERIGEPNLFMVGDVKQSIYRFRQARPDLFLDKYNRYLPEGKDVVIELRKNFRSHDNVLNCINDIFFRIMKSSIGGIDYTEDVKLNPGKDYDRQKKDAPVEVVLVDKTEIEVEGKGTYLCAQATAKRIEELLATTSYQKRDIVILLRNTKSSGKIYADVLRSHGIDAAYSAKIGFFETPEIQDICNYLQIIDNPRQDIALAGVMRSYFAYFTTEELALIKGSKKHTQFYDCVKKYASEENELGLKCKAFLEQLEAYRHLNSLSSMRELLTELIYNSGYYDYTGLLPSGRLRRENLKRLIDQVDTFEKSSYHGLFQFLKYIEKLRENEQDFSEASVSSEYDDVVRIMTIHNSKGLEFPVVILADAQSDFIMEDLKAPVLKDSSYGIALSAVDLSTRTRSEGLPRKMLKLHMKKELIGEELRLLYVALTRAVERLIVIAAPQTDNPIAHYEAYAEEPLEYSYLLEHPRYISYIAPVALSKSLTGYFQVRVITAEDILLFIEKGTVVNSFRFKDYINRISKAPMPSAGLKAIMEYEYPYTSAVTLRSKYSVSEIKHMAMEDNENLSAKVIEPQRNKPIPYFVQDGQVDHSQNAGTIYGNAYHKFFELLDYSLCKDAQSCRLYLAELVEHNRISKEYAEILNMKIFEHFLHTDLGREMAAAAGEKKLFREQPFIMEIPGTYVDEQALDCEAVLVQGIIDAFYEIDDEICIVDYKTDHVPEDASGEQILIERYRPQLEIYSEAVLKATGKKVRGAYLYSTRLGRAIRVD